MDTKDIYGQKTMFKDTMGYNGYKDNNCEIGIYRNIKPDTMEFSTGYFDLIIIAWIN